MTYFFDNNFPPRLVKALREAGVSAIALREEFDEDTEDTEWLPQVAAKGWVVITCERRIRKRAAERRALEESGATVVFVPKGVARQGFWGEWTWLGKSWLNIEAAVSEVEPGTHFLAQQNGKVEKWP